MAGRKVSKAKDPGPPTNPRLGQLFFDTATKTIRKWNGKNWGEELRPGEIAGKKINSERTNENE